MASTIRVRATANGDTTEVQALIQHPMDSGFVKDAKGELIPPHFIQQLTFEHNGKTVFLANWGTGGLEGPLCEVQLQGRQQGRRSQDQLGRQQGRDRHHHGEDRSDDAHAQRSCFSSFAALVALALACAARPRSPHRQARSRGRRQGVPELLHQEISEGEATRTSSTVPIRWTRTCTSSGRRRSSFRLTSSRSKPARRCSRRRSRTARPMPTASRTRASASARTIPISTRRKARSSRWSSRSTAAARPMARRPTPM